MLQLTKEVFYLPRVINKSAFYFGGIALGVLFFIRFAIIFSYVPEITGVDNNFVYTVLRMLAGFSPYSNPEEFPYLGNIYSPLYFDVCYLIGKAIGVNPDIPIQVFRLCKSVSLLFDVTTLFFLYSSLKKNISISNEISIFSVAIFFSILCFLAYTYNRVDSLFLTLYAIAIYLLTKPDYLDRNINMVIIALVCTTCVFSKQNGIILPLLVFVFLIISNYKKNAFVFILSFSLLFFMFYFAYTRLIKYEFLSAYTVNGVQNKIDPEWFYTYIFKPLANSFLILPLITGLVISVYFTLLSSSRYEKGLAIIFLIQLGFSLGAAFKWGSSLGYFNESFFLSAILIATFIISYIKSSTDILIIFWYMLPVVSLFFIHTAIQNYLFFVHKQEDKKLYYTQQKTVSEYLQPRLENKHVMDMCNQNRDFFKSFLYKQMAVPHFDTIDCCLLPDGNFDYSKLKAELQNGEIKYIIFPKDHFNESIWGVSLDSYKKDTTINMYDIYRFVN